jgi:thiamine-phosphate pyrophosphorylase
MSNLLRGLYAITDEHLTPDEVVVERAEEALKRGVSILQYRNKKDKDEDIEAITRELLALCRRYSVPFLIDDRPHLAHKIGADGIHIGKDDMSLKEARAIFPKGIIGVSCYGSVRKAKEAQEEGADYVAFGSFFPSPTKPHSGVISLDVLAKAKEALTIPICAIGGISTQNIATVAKSQVEMIALVSAVFDGDIERNMKNLLEGAKR